MKMRLSDRQSDGMIVAVIIAVLVYTLSSLSFLLKSQVCDLPYTERSSDQLIVGISGNAGNQGVYWLTGNAKVYDVLNAAGIGNLEKFDAKTLQRPLFTGNVVFIESDGRIVVGEMDNARKVALRIPININKATLEDLILIPGIGEATASQIIQFREASGNFRALEELMNIRGIKEKKFAHLKRYLFAGYTSE